MSGKLQTVHVRINDRATGQPTPCRVRFTGPDGTYYAPFGRLTDFAVAWGQDVGGNLWLHDDQKYAYIDGSCEIQLPPGSIQIGIGKGFEYLPINQQIALRPGQLSIRLALERWHNARNSGWYSGDIHVEYLAPNGALLEAAAEDVAVVNLLARTTFVANPDCHPLPAIPNILSFSGQQPALEMPGHLVVVNTLNWHPKLGRLILLNCHRVVYPLHFGSPHGADDWSLSDWCDQCHRKRGLVISDGCSGLAELLVGKVDALEATREWGGWGVLLGKYHAILGLGYRLPLVAGSGKRSNQQVVGRFRTYAQLLNDQDLTYANWIEAVRAGRTFISNGPLVYLTVNGEGPGSIVELENPRKTVHIHAEAHSVFPIKELIVMASGGVKETVVVEGDPARALLDFEMSVERSGWVRAGCYGSNQTAETSPVYIQVRDQPAPPPEAEDLRFLFDELDEMVGWVRTEARCETDQQRDRLVGIFLAAKEELRKRAAGIK